MKGIIQVFMLYYKIHEFKYQRYIERSFIVLYLFLSFDSKSKTETLNHRQPPWSSWSHQKSGSVRKAMGYQLTLRGKNALA